MHQNIKYSSRSFPLNADKEICKPQIYTQIFLVNMTLEKPPWGKPVEEKFYYGDLKQI
jgi:hypothetical protein